jgi:hypothetical protein
MADRVRMIMAGVLLSAVDLYRMTLGAVLPNSCRFSPTCSSYAAEAIRTHGPWRGAWLSFRRVLRCHPFRPGGYDPVPARQTQEEKLTSR